MQPSVVSTRALNFGDFFKKKLAKIEWKFQPTQRKVISLNIATQRFCEILINAAEIAVSWALLALLFTVLITNVR